MGVTLFTQLALLGKLGVVVAIVLHSLALVPQWQAQYFNPRFLHLSLYGLVLAVAHGAVLALAAAALPSAPAGRVNAAGWCIGAAVLLNLVVGAQNLLAVVALTRLHRPSALIAHSLRGAVRPLLWASALLALAATCIARGWF
ncbi:hypothetical protein IP92_01165 [Pseudoduganella flava]|uniref:Uncharacterized protein n=1 Tax=Pseudoduganella flava TaxID=871742 RepID=A0A562PZS2_9BURK|nr:hypothetical protein [Pseudoduganella flava]QGZ38504.1 hypothetical protein GO485_05165 [Pseudoduganella flava]TWI49941.1 hypothetical protein IP92_01165 [Pseudoduganella flava]